MNRPGSATTQTATVALLVNGRELNVQVTAPTGLTQPLSLLPEFQSLTNQIVGHAVKGAEESGAVFLKIARLDGTCTVLDQARRGSESELVWVKPLGDWTDEDKARAFFDKQIKFDPDLWIVEIEDRQGRTFVDEKVV